MTIEVYIDIVFMVNFVMDFLLLYLQSKALRRRVSLNRVFIGAFVGAGLMCVITIIPKLNYIVFLSFSYLLTSMLMVLVTFKPKKIIEIVRLTFILYGVAVGIGGIIFFLYYYSGAGLGINRIIKGEVFNGINLQLLLLFAFCAIVIFVIFMSILSRVSNVTTRIYELQLFYKDRSVKVPALLDTGNHLYDPITNWPVIISEARVLQELFESEVYQVLSRMSQNLYDAETAMKVHDMLGIKTRLIPFTSLGMDNGMLLGIIIDRVAVEKGKKIKTNENVVVGIYHKSLSRDNSYSVLLHPELI